MSVFSVLTDASIDVINHSQVQRSDALWQLLQDQYLSPDEITEFRGTAANGETYRAAPQQQQQQEPQQFGHDHTTSTWSHVEERMLARAVTRSSLAAAMAGECIELQKCVSVLSSVRICFCVHNCSPALDLS